MVTLDFIRYQCVQGYIDTVALQLWVYITMDPFLKDNLLDMYNTKRDINELLLRCRYINTHETLTTSLAGKVGRSHKRIDYLKYNDVYDRYRNDSLYNHIVELLSSTSDLHLDKYINSYKYFEQLLYNYQTTNINTCYVNIAPILFRKSKNYCINRMPHIVVYINMTNKLRRNPSRHTACPYSIDKYMNTYKLTFFTDRTAHPVLQMIQAYYYELYHDVYKLNNDGIDDILAFKLKAHSLPDYMKVDIFLYNHLSFTYESSRSTYESSRLDKMSIFTLDNIDKRDEMVDTSVYSCEWVMDVSRSIKVMRYIRTTLNLSRSTTNVYNYCKWIIPITSLNTDEYYPHVIPSNCIPPWIDKTSIEVALQVYEMYGKRPVASDIRNMSEILEMLPSNDMIMIQMLQPLIYKQLFLWTGGSLYQYISKNNRTFNSPDYDIVIDGSHLLYRFESMLLHDYVIDSVSLQNLYAEMLLHTKCVYNDTDAYNTTHSRRYIDKNMLSAVNEYNNGLCVVPWTIMINSWIADIENTHHRVVTILQQTVDIKIVYKYSKHYATYVNGAYIMHDDERVMFNDFKHNLNNLMHTIRKTDTHNILDNMTLNISSKYIDEDSKIFWGNHTYKFSIYEHLRVKIQVEGMTKPIDLFVNKCPLTFLRDFHVDAVRSCCDGNEVYMSAEAIMAIRTGINWRPHRPGPAFPSIVRKYADRGVLTLLHPDDIHAIYGELADIDRIEVSVDSSETSNTNIDTY